MEGFCRGCLIKYDEPMELLQYTEKNRRLFVYSTGLQVKRNDTFTFQLCKDCYLNMKLACKFKKLCRTSDKRFRNYLGLKNVGDPADFCTFLKNNDDTLTFRLPMTSGNSTPANQKCRDEDNESTCTSIRNFMSDILQGEEMPDTEARIIREVIEEEADVLDDSLDSHWMQDDMSIDTDFRLDFSFSAFSTPRSVINDHCYTPKKLADQKEEQNNFYPEISKKQSKVVNDFTNAFTTTKNVDEFCDFNTDERDIVESQMNTSKNGQNIKEFCNFRTDECDSIEELETNVFETRENVKDLCNYETEENDTNEKSSANAYKEDLNSRDLCNFGIDQINSFDKSQGSIDMPTLDEIDNGKSESNLDLPSLDSFGIDKSVSNIDLLTLGDLGIEKPESNMALPTIDDSDKGQINIENVYGPKDDIENTQYSHENINIDDLLKDKPCPIDKNLEKALQNKDNKEFSLDDLLVSPKVIPGSSAASTPTITNILFGEKLDFVEKSINPKLGQCIEKFEDVQGDIEIFEEFFQNDTKEFDIEDIEKRNLKIEDIKKSIEFDDMDKAISEKAQVNIDIVEVKKQIKGKKVKKEIDISTAKYDDKFDLENCYCCLCKKKFTSSRALSIHFSKTHHIKIITPKKTYIKSKLCNSCGKEIKDFTNFNRHFKRCSKSKEVFKCERCPVECTSQAKLDRHMTSHTLTNTKKKNQQEYVCTICGAVISKRGNYNLHLRRHTNDYKASCEVCGKGFYRTSDFKTHMRQHNGDTPFACAYCPRLFARKDVLNKHIRIHNGERLYQCDYCDKKYYTKFDLSRHITTKLCLKKRGLWKDDENKDTDLQEPEQQQVTVIYTTGDDNSIQNQLPFLETELSN